MTKKALTAEEQKAKKNVVPGQVVSVHKTRPDGVEISRDGKSTGAKNVSTEVKQ